MPLQIKSKDQLELLINKDDPKVIYKEIFDKIVKDKFDEVRE